MAFSSIDWVLDIFAPGRAHATANDCTGFGWRPRQKKRELPGRKWSEMVGKPGYTSHIPTSCASLAAPIVMTGVAETSMGEAVLGGVTATQRAAPTVAAARPTFRAANARPALPNARAVLPAK
jgi:hypothetical protein